MMFRLIGGGIAVVGVMIVGAFTSYDRTANYLPAEGEVFRIDRTCTFNTEEHGQRGTVVAQKEQDCSTTDEFASLREKHARDIVGNAIVKVSYTSPIDHSYQTAELKFTGRDEPFYTLNAHDKIKILVSKTDPTKIEVS
jgi:hypothetical protein